VGAGSKLGKDGKRLGLRIDGPRQSCQFWPVTVLWAYPRTSNIKKAAPSGCTTLIGLDSIDERGQHVQQTPIVHDPSAPIPDTRSIASNATTHSIESRCDAVPPHYICAGHSSRLWHLFERTMARRRITCTTLQDFKWTGSCGAQELPSQRARWQQAGYAPPH